MNEPTVNVVENPPQLCEIYLSNARPYKQKLVFAGFEQETGEPVFVVGSGRGLKYVSQQMASRTVLELHKMNLHVQVDWVDKVVP